MRRRPVIVLATLVLLVVGGTALARHGRPRPPGIDAFVGQTREQIIAQVGPPASRWPGDYGAGAATQSTPCESMTFAVAGGTLYVSVTFDGHRWRCYSSTWLAEGGAF